MRSLHKYVKMALDLFPRSEGATSEERIQDENPVHYSVTRCSFRSRKKDRKTKMLPMQKSCLLDAQRRRKKGFL